MIKNNDHREKTIDGVLIKPGEIKLVDLKNKELHSKLEIIREIIEKPKKIEKNKVFEKKKVFKKFEEEIEETKENKE